MKKIIALIAMGLMSTVALAVPPAEPNGLVHAEAHEVDRHQVVYGSVYDFGKSYVFTISNGHRWNPLHLNVHFQYFDSAGNLLGEVVHYGWCPASKFGSANRCDVRFQAMGDNYFAAATRIKMFGERTRPRARANRGVGDWQPTKPGQHHPY